MRTLITPQRPSRRIWLLLVLAIGLPILAAHAQSSILIPYRSGQRWGFADTTGRVVITPQYDKVLGFRNGFSIVNKENKSGIINKQGTIVVEPIYDVIVQRTQGGYFARQAEYRGIFSDQGKWLIEPIYEDMYSWPGYDQLIRVKKENKFGLLKISDDYEKMEKVVLPLRYEYLGMYTDQGVKTIVTEENGQRTIWAIEENLDLKQLSTAPVPAEEEDEPEFVDMSIDGDEDGGPKVDPRARVVQLSKMKDDHGRDILLVVDNLYQRRRDVPSIIDTVAIPFEQVMLYPLPFSVKMPALQPENEEKAGEHYSHYNWALLHKGGKVAIMNPMGELIADWTCEEVLPRLIPLKDQTPWLVCKKAGKWGIIDAGRKEIVPFIYDEINPEIYYKNTRWLKSYQVTDPLITKLGAHYGLINGKHEVVVPHVMDEVLLKHRGFPEGDYHLLRQNGKYGIYESQIFLPPVFDRPVDRVIIFDDYPVAGIVDEAGQFLGYGDPKGFYYFEH